MRLHLPLLLLVTLSTGPAAAQPAAPGVSLEFLVADREGRTPADLTPADVELKVGGKERPIVSLEHVEPPDGGRRILLLVDEPTLYSFEPIVKEAAGRLFASLLPADRVSFISTRRRAATVTRGPDAITQALGAMTTGPGVLYTCLADTLRNVEALAQTLPPGRASTLVVIGRGHPEGAATGSEGDAAPCTPRRDDMRRAAEVIGGTQINLVFLTVSETERSWGFDTLAANLGGTSHLLTWADNTGLERAIRGTRSFYRAAFVADPKGPARPQRVELRVKRPGVKVSAPLVIATRPRT
ncbi:MAG TPA: hypothetical protein VM364_08690 [Vicinamibacterales bacterium]|nr:hypothetical protein [Vicinamibacterales bacterium]